jgi:hypothetical protein
MDTEPRSPRRGGRRTNRDIISAEKRAWGPDAGFHQFAMAATAFGTHAISLLKAVNDQQRRQNAELAEQARASAIPSIYAAACQEPVPVDHEP